MFDFIGMGSRSVYDKSEISRIIFEGSSVTIEFQEGYSENDAFVSVGTDHITLSGAEGLAAIEALSAAEGVEGKTEVAEQLVVAARTPVVEE